MSDLKRVKHEWHGLGWECSEGDGQTVCIYDPAPANAQKLFDYYRDHPEEGVTVGYLEGCTFVDSEKA